MSEPKKTGKYKGSETEIEKPEVQEECQNRQIANGSTIRVFLRWLRIHGILATIGAGIFAIANPECAAGEVALELLKGATGGLIVGLVVVLVRNVAK